MNIARNISHGKWNFRGIGQQAEILGVHRTHLWKVLTGRRKSASLLNRYASLMAAGTKNAQPTELTPGS